MTLLMTKGAGARGRAATLGGRLSDRVAYASGQVAAFILALVAVLALIRDATPFPTPAYATDDRLAGVLSLQDFANHDRWAQSAIPSTLSDFPPPEVAPSSVAVTEPTPNADAPARVETQVTATEPLATSPPSAEVAAAPTVMAPKTSQAHPQPPAAKPVVLGTRAPEAAITWARFIAESDPATQPKVAEAKPSAPPRGDQASVAPAAAGTSETAPVDFESLLLQDLGALPSTEPKASEITTAALGSSPAVVSETSQIPARSVAAASRTVDRARHRPRAATPPRRLKTAAIGSETESSDQAATKPVKKRAIRPTKVRSARNGPSSPQVASARKSKSAQPGFGAKFFDMDGR